MFACSLHRPPPVLCSRRHDAHTPAGGSSLHQPNKNGETCSLLCSFCKPSACWCLLTYEDSEGKSTSSSVRSPSVSSPLLRIPPTCSTRGDSGSMSYSIPAQCTAVGRFKATLSGGLLLRCFCWDSCCNAMLWRLPIRVDREGGDYPVTQARSSCCSSCAVVGSKPRARTTSEAAESAVGGAVTRLMPPHPHLPNLIFSPTLSLSHCLSLSPLAAVSLSLLTAACRSREWHRRQSRSFQ